MKPHVVCCWEWRHRWPPWSGGPKWVLIETHVTDEDGYEYHVNESQRLKYDWAGWMYKTKDDLDFPEPILGRAVTSWDMERGVRLQCLHPPEESSTVWLSRAFYERLISLPDWPMMLQGGHRLFFGTAEAAAVSTEVLGGRASAPDPG